LLELELVFAFVELLDAGLLELDLPFWKLEELIESIEVLDFAFEELDFPLAELLDESLLELDFLFWVLEDSGSCPE
jgi:hypothetical protein